jgi:hypothetical protein
MGDVLCKRIACGRFLEAHNFSKTILVILLIKLVFPIAHRGKLLHADNFRSKTARRNHPKSPPQAIYAAPKSKSQAFGDSVEKFCEH